jgi:hypothetical protein
VALRETPDAPEIVTGVVALTAVVETLKVALVLPALTVTLDGTAATAALLLESETTEPPDGAAPVSVTVPCDGLPPTTLDGFSEIAESAGAAVPGVTVNTAPQVVFNSA